MFICICMRIFHVALLEQDRCREHLDRDISRGKQKWLRVEGAGGRAGASGRASRSLGMGPKCKPCAVPDRSVHLQCQGRTGKIQGLEDGSILSPNVKSLLSCHLSCALEGQVLQILMKPTLKQQDWAENGMRLQ